MTEDEIYYKNQLKCQSETIDKLKKENDDLTFRLENEVANSMLLTEAINDIKKRQKDIKQRYVKYYEEMNIKSIELSEVLDDLDIALYGRNRMKIRGGTLVKLINSQGIAVKTDKLSNIIGYLNNRNLITIPDDYYDEDDNGFKSTFYLNYRKIFVNFDRLCINYRLELSE